MGRNHSQIFKIGEKVRSRGRHSRESGNPGFLLIRSRFPIGPAPESRNRGAFGNDEPKEKYFFRKYYLTFAFLLLLIGCREKIDIKAGKQVEEAAQRIFGVKAQIRDGGQVKWQLTSPESEIFEGRNSLLAAQPNIKVYSANELSSTLSSGTGNVNLDTMDVELYGGAVAVSTTGAKISGEHFAYLSNKNLIVSTTPVQIIRDGSITTGAGLEATPDLSHITIKNQRLELEPTQLNHTPK